MPDRDARTVKRPFPRVCLGVIITLCTGAPPALAAQTKARPLELIRR